jgi:integrase
LEAVKRWINHGELHGIRPDVCAVRRSRIANHIADTWIGRTKLSRLKTKHIDDFYVELLADGKSRNLAADVMTIIKATLKYAQRRDLVAQNVSTPIKIIREEYKKKVVGVNMPFKEEAAAMIEHAPDRWRNYITTALFTGMRPSEMRALPWGRVNFTDRTIEVMHSADSGRRVHLPKTEAGQRTIPMLGPVYEALTQHAKDALEPLVGRHPGYRRTNESELAKRYGRMPDKPIMTVKQYLFYQRHFDHLEKLANNGEWEALRAWRYPGGNNGPKQSTPGMTKSGYVTRLYQYRGDLLAAHECVAGDNVVDLTALNPEAVVFPNYAGKILHLCTLQEGMDLTQMAAGVTKLNPETGEREPKYSLYAMRHFFASWRIACGDRPEQIKELMGHKSIKMTYDNYGHLFPRTKQDLQRMDDDAAELLGMTKRRQNATILKMNK